MDALTSAVIEGAKSIFKLSLSGIKTISKYEENICELQEEISYLRNKKILIEEEVSIAIMDGKTPKQQVTEWLRKVSRAEDAVRPLLQMLQTPDQHIDGRSFKMLQQYQQSRRVANKLEHVKELNSTYFETVAPEKSSPIKAMEEMQVSSLFGQQAASDMMKLLEILNSDDNKRIGVWGKGGIGKTTSVKNLINHLCNSSPNSFNIVIWVQVSRDLNLSMIQTQIAERLHLKVEAGDTTHSLANRILRRLKMRVEATRRKILLVLDDVWEKIDLDAVGIPSRDSCCKILLTTRSFDVCRDMSVDAPFQLNLMSEDDAWNLFVQSAGSVLYLDGIQSPARKIVASCRGLPLAIKTLGKSLRDTPQTAIWRNTYLRWRCSSPLFKNIEKEVFRPLALSYHSLPSKILQQCFLFCSLYPASFSIDVVELIQCWVSDGLIHENQTVEEAFNYGVALIEHLKDSCLLDQDGGQGTVKMHDVFRDLAILLSQNEELFGFHCQSSLPFNQMPKESSRRVSLIGCKIYRLQEYPVYSNLTVLFLQGNPIKIIPDDYFLNLKSLRVLNLSKTEITSLPSSFLCLVELRSLYLRGCFSLTKLPSLEPLCKLIVLDLSSTPIRELPEGLGSLCRLRELNLSYTRLLKKIASGSISGLSSLETLDMSFSAYNWNPKMSSCHQNATFDELLSLDRLSVLKIRLDSVDSLASASSWIKKLRKFDIQISPNDSNFDAQSNEKRLVLRGVDLLQEHLQSLLHNTTSLSLLTCEGMAQRHWLSLSSLMSLTISNCSGIRILISQEKSSHAMFPNLQHLVLDHLKNLETIVEGILSRGICLSNLKTIQVLDCPKLKGTISYAMLRHVKKLEEIKVSGCENMCRVIESGGQKKKNLPVLRVIEVKNMVKLRTICDGMWVCPVLQQIEVSHCFELKKLPISVGDSCSLKEIRGDVKWWNNLIWENHDDKSFFLKHFQAYSREDCLKRQKYK
ncbi:disease resistance protein At4g27190 [Lactuca sativa]|uniref:AAA+ ATPase domain-containing protein n=1 Tax=Lactuca sativa TaxID=4236 RepID=A0A9R1UYH3_LACSA|nr:disease resistance protein At4g27190 [Lactuca sativa]KAJ0196141.1 hypothetical protein LSAT_V11C700384680 [Lactuca sativa]